MPYFSIVAHPVGLTKENGTFDTQIWVEQAERRLSGSIPMVWTIRMVATTSSLWVLCGPFTCPESANHMRCSQRSYCAPPWPRSARPPSYSTASTTASRSTNVRSVCVCCLSHRAELVDRLYPYRGRLLPTHRRWEPRVWLLNSRFS